MWPFEHSNRCIANASILSSSISAQRSQTREWHSIWSITGVWTLIIFTRTSKKVSSNKYIPSPLLDVDDYLQYWLHHLDEFDSIHILYVLLIITYLTASYKGKLEALAAYSSEMMWVYSLLPSICCEQKSNWFKLSNI